MAFQDYLIIDGVILPLPTSYELSYKDIEAETGGETEAGTIQRDVIRFGLVTIAVSFNCSPSLVKKLSTLKKSANLNVKYLDTEELLMKETQMYIEGFSAKLVKDTSYKGLWEVYFSLHEY